MTMEPNPGTRAVSAFEIDDVFLIGSDCHVDLQFNQSQQIAEMPLRYRLLIEPHVLAQSRKPVDVALPEFYILRYIAVGEVLMLKSKMFIEGEEPAADDVLAKLLLKFAVDYSCKKGAWEDKAAVGSFTSNVAFHVWPYWREAVHDFAARMRLPKVTIPMMKANVGVPDATPKASD